ncbi:MAG: RHS repeat-associated core domain-containing protein [Flavobacteriia bacterium]|nr:RHS repeat-associated core domain-containing protein [Flavobacteriia bacterium]OIP46606.1 MAG: hypothetical protein AUK46_08040 [Flavobacteriaceae bacterium CG2_30_31_66]PIV96230.1 MAG: hypothetical protein COW43_09380 [Flavobacteriaceae bacterium CG17_big_fil_post_rev_8_21_14_2_50_31_13]PIZ10611.1 MAG: hypothetical protein COY55_07875 [Flavobacteriaceae bacterium CG_4_10_14_0_8_um_filter_31_99]PJC09315.1 MAG: hypothetical protein CO067_10445 [Flavobacteriaceae bacterium CG_4_9_14_0_8_um_fil
MKNIEYDRNGNILSLERFAPNAAYTQSDAIDQLVYSYKLSGNSNQLMGVEDTSLHTDGFNDGNTTVEDYFYDDNGNLTVDENKKITSIKYNQLNLPTEIIFSTSGIGSNSIKYYYDANGTKLKKEVYQFGLNHPKVTEYCGGFIYEKDFPSSSAIGDNPPLVFQFFSHAEGYVKLDNGVFNYVYQYKDHLGNIRLSYTDANNDGIITASTEIIEENNYYPFGLKHEGYNFITSGNGNGVAQKFGYNGQELEKSLGLNVVEMDFRLYDASLGRFYNPDRLAEHAASISPFRFGFNNPIYWSDPSGLFEVDKYGNIVVNNKNGDGEVSKLLEFLKNNKDASIDDISKHIFTSGDFSYDLDEIVMTFGSSSSRSSAASNLESQINSASDKITSFGGNINFTKKRSAAEWAWDNKYQIGITAGALANGYAGFTEFQAGAAMFAAPTGITQVAGLYSMADGVVRMISTPLQIYGTWTGNTALENSPSNLLGSIGFMYDNRIEGDWKTGGRAHLTMELMGDFGLSRRKLIQAATKGFTNPNKWKNIINIGNATWQIVRPYKDAIQQKKDGKL